MSSEKAFWSWCEDSNQAGEQVEKAPEGTALATEESSASKAATPCKAALSVSTVYKHISKEVQLIIVCDGLGTRCMQAGTAEKLPMWLPHY